MSYMWRRVAVTALALATTASLTQAGSGVAQANRATPAGGGQAVVTSDSAQDERDLFTGVFFLTGPYGDRAVEALQLPAELVATNRTTQAQEYVDAVVTTVGELEPAFFAQFSSSMRSGDPFKVESVMDEGGRLIGLANDRLGASEATQVAPNRPPVETNAFSLFVVAGVVAVAAVIVAVYAASVAVQGTAVVDTAGTSPNGSTDLVREQAISALTEAFAS